MKYLVYVPPDDEAGIDKSHHDIDRDYFFLMCAFSKVFSELGEVITLGEAAEADAIHAQCLSMDEACVLFSFAPPHKTPLGLSCPMVPVFAWEYPDIPERIEENSWKDDLRNDWRYVFAQVSGVVTLSTYAANAVRRAMGTGFPIQSIPLPLPCLGQPRQSQASTALSGAGVLRVNAAVADSRCMGLNIDGLLCLEEEDGTLFKQSDEINLPKLNRSPERPHVFSTSEALKSKAEILLEGESEPLACGWDIPKSMPTATRLDGVVYTALLTPSAKRTNWHDLITAFCWAFRNHDDATLLLKLSDNDITHYHHELLMALTKMSPMKCRVIGIYGQLTESEQIALRNVTTYYVNTSTHEALCHPLMEFLGHGIPAISPDHTAMADFINDEVAFVVKSQPGMPMPWPHGDGDLDRTSHHQLDWESLTSAFQQSHDLARTKSSRYSQMCKAAYSKMQTYCSPHIVRAQIKAFIDSQTLTLARSNLPPVHTIIHSFTAIS